MRSGVPRGRSLAPPAPASGRTVAARLGLLAVLLAACGARGGLRVPCEVALEPAVPRVIVLVNHSAAYSRPRQFGPPYFLPHTSFGEVLVALEAALPTLDRDTLTGALVFPEVGVSRIERHEWCTVPAALSIPLQRQASAPVVAMLREWTDERGISTNDELQPAGPVPMFAALRAARERFGPLSERDPRFVVLIASSAPQCNEAIPRESCDCPLPGNPWPCTEVGTGQSLCLDWARIEAELTAMRAEGIRTIVLAERFYEPLAWYVARMNRLAELGGAPRGEGPLRWYVLEEPDALAAGLAAEVVAAGLCRLRVHGDAGADVAGLALFARGRGAIVADPSRRDGWAWTDAAHTELVVHGPACDRVVRERPALYLGTTDSRCAP